MLGIETVNCCIIEKHKDIDVYVWFCVLSQPNFIWSSKYSMPRLIPLFVIARLV